MARGTQSNDPRTYAPSGPIPIARNFRTFLDAAKSSGIYMTDPRLTKMYQIIGRAGLSNNQFDAAFSTPPKRRPEDMELAEYENWQQSYEQATAAFNKGVNDVGPLLGKMSDKDLDDILRAQNSQFSKKSGPYINVLGTDAGVGTGNLNTLRQFVESQAQRSSLRKDYTPTNFPASDLNSQTQMAEKIKGFGAQMLDNSKLDSRVIDDRITYFQKLNNTEQGREALNRAFREFDTKVGRISGRGKTKRLQDTIAAFGKTEVDAHLNDVKAETDAAKAAASAPTAKAPNFNDYSAMSSATINDIAETGLTKTRVEAKREQIRRQYAPEFAANPELRNRRELEMNSITTPNAMDRYAAMVEQHPDEALSAKETSALQKSMKYDVAGDLEKMSMGQALHSTVLYTTTEGFKRGISNMGMLALSGKLPPEFLPALLGIGAVGGAAQLMAMNATTGFLGNFLTGKGTRPFELYGSAANLGISQDQIQSAIIGNASTGRKSFGFNMGTVMASLASGVDQQSVVALMNQLTSQGMPQKNGGIISNFIGGNGPSGMNLLSSISPYIYDPSKQFSLLQGYQTALTNQPGYRQIVNQTAQMPGSQLAMYAALSGGNFMDVMSKAANGDFTDIIKGQQNFVNMFPNDGLATLATGFSGSTLHQLRTGDTGKLAQDMAVASDPATAEKYKTAHAYFTAKQTVDNANKNPALGALKQIGEYIFKGANFGSDAYRLEVIDQLNSMSQNGQAQLNQNDANVIANQLGGGSSGPLLSRSSYASRININISKNGVDATSQDALTSFVNSYGTTTPSKNDVSKSSQRG